MCTISAPKVDMCVLVQNAVLTIHFNKTPRHSAAVNVPAAETSITADLVQLSFLIAAVHVMLWLLEVFFQWST